MTNPTLDILISQQNTMITQLNGLLTSDNLTSTQEELINDIKAIASAKAELLEDLKSSNISTESEQIMEILNRQLESKKNQLYSIEHNNVNKLRLIEINDYYSSLYYDRMWLVIIVFVVSLHIIILCTLYKFIGFSSNILYICLFGTLVVGLFFFIRRFADINARDNMNYEQYNWGFNPNNLPEVDTSNPGGISVIQTQRCPTNQ